MERQNDQHAANVSRSEPLNASRREFLAQGSRMVVGSVLAGSVMSRAYAGEDNTIRVALVGCGGRGSGAAGNALSSKNGPTKLIAMADLFENRLATSCKALKEQFGERVDVPPDRQFVGFDAYRKLVDLLRPGDIMIQATHAAFRPTHVAYAVDKGINVFMEKSFAPDPGGTKDILRIGEIAKKKNLTIGCGLMCRHSAARQALINKIRDGVLGHVQLIRAYRMDPGARMGPFKGGQSELLWQIRRPYFFHWVSSGWFIEMMIHRSMNAAGSRTPGRSPPRVWAAASREATIAARTCTRTPSSTRSPTGPRRWSTAAASRIVTTSSPPGSTARNAPPSSPAMSTPRPC
ncbi:MAG: hypothetical protein JW955_15780 [Sedimentisphaerales bacterium]|nr:hypothetical protein [Sedimentisphaerales bacterium]